MDLENKIAIVSGAGQGISYEVARQMVNEGATVVIGDLNEETGKAAAEKLGEKCDFVQLNVSQEDSWKNIFDYTMKKYGRVDALVNGAGITGGSADIEHETIDDWNVVFNVNAMGVFLGVQNAMKNMTQGGSIVNINALAGICAEPVAVAYSASKGAGRMITKSAALYGAQKSPMIRVNSVHPGPTMTPMVEQITKLQPEVMKSQMDKIPMKKFAEAEDIANMVIYLVSDKAKYITGGEFIVDGGMLAGF